MQQILYTNNSIKDLNALIGDIGADRVVLLTDSNTHRLCRPLIDVVANTMDADITIAAGDVNKTLDALQQVWQGMQDAGSTRHSLLVNLGGGMVTDLGGFAAATFKRGISFINIPTTLLAMVDAAVGGKTGINFGGLKNEVGAFAEAHSVIIDTTFLRTLDAENICSGYAEMLKHALISDAAMWQSHIAFDLLRPDLSVLQKLVRQSIEVKQHIVAEDPHEKGIRKALNLGHTVGHAFESLLMQRGTPVLHGYAVAWGIVVELFMSAAVLQFDTEIFRNTARFITSYYGRPAVTCDDYEALYALMLHDKKNTAGHINFTLLAGIGDIRLDCQTSKDLVFDALDFLREA